MRRLITPLAVLIFSLSDIIGQYDATLQSYVPLSPEAQAQSNYVTTPQIGYTGQVSTSIPITVVRDNQLSQGISLNYHNSGIRLTQVSSHVGMGFSLSAGGVISRSVRGAPDERLYAGQLSGYYSDGVDPAWFTNSAYYEQVSDGRRDTESDVYHYSFQGYTGSFVFDEEQNIVERERSDLSIEVIETGYDYNKLLWLITTPDGTKYYFGDDNTTDGSGDDAVSYSLHYMQGENTVGAPGSRTPLVDGWYLVRVESYDGLSEISYEYDDYEHYSYRNLATSVRVGIDSIGRNLVNVSQTGLQNLNRVLVTESVVPRMTDIRTSNRHITFHYKTTEVRRDVDPQVSGFFPLANIGITQTDGARNLDYIIESSENGDCLKRYDFAQTYFTSPTDGFTGTLGGGMERSDAFGPYMSDMRRLRLISYREVSCDLMVSKTHEFHYTSNTVPRRLSYGQDHWGYANGQTDNLTLLPNQMIDTARLSNPPIDLSHLTLLADRSVSEADMLFGLLDSIVYPTGGSRVYEYEAHDYHGTEIFETGATVADVRNTNCSNPSPPAACTTCCLSETIEIGPYTYNSSSAFRYEMLAEAIKTPNDGSSALIEVQILLKPGTGPWQLMDEFVLDSDNDYSRNKCYSQLALPFSDNGAYAFRMTATANRALFMHLQLKEFSRSPVTRNQKVGGLRIRSITDHPLVGPSVKRNYVYTTGISTGISSGRLIGKPTYYLEMPDDAAYSINNGASCLPYRYLFTSGNQFPISSAQGSHIGYERVYEFISGHTWYTEHVYYDDATHESSFIQSYPALPDNYTSHLMGMPKSLTTYDNTSTMVSATTYDYVEYATGDTATSYVAEAYGICGTLIMESYSYDHERKYVYLDEQVDQLDGRSTTTSYSYARIADHNLPSEVSMMNSDGSVHRTNTYYAYDYTFSNFLIKNLPTDVTVFSVDDTLLVQHRIHEPFLVEQYVDDVLVGGSATIYGYYNSSGNPTIIGDDYLYPEEVLHYEYSWDENDNPVDDGWQSQERYETYDVTVGRPSAISRTGWADDILLTWSGSGQLTQWQYDDYIRSYSYEPTTDYLSQSTEIDGTTIDYTYDDLLRPHTITNCQGVIQTYSYHFGTGSDMNYEQVSTIYPTFGDLSNHTIVDLSFLDGLGRPIQQLAIGQHPDDPVLSIAIETIYDDVGRVSQVSEPTAVSHGAGSYTALPVGSEYTTRSYYEDPLSRPYQVTPPSWHATTYSYGSNSATIAGYPSNTLAQITETDPNGNKAITYTDRRGREVLMRRESADGSEQSDTETLWDDKDNKRYVLPPGISLSDTDARYAYSYHPNGQLAIRDVPDAEPIYYRYNDRDLLNYVQDGMQRANNRWWGIAYDGYGHAIREGFSSIANPTNGSSAIPTLVDTLISRTYSTSNNIYMGKLTVEELDFLMTSEQYKTSYVYDGCGRSSEISNSIFEAATTTMINTLVNSYDGRDAVRAAEHSFTDGGGLTKSFTKLYHYDHAGRSIGESIRDEDSPTATPLRLSTIHYTAKDQIEQRQLGTVVPISYDYLPNGYLTDMSSAVFSQHLYYANPFDTNATARMNGDISTQTWQHMGQDMELYHYRYDYKNQVDSALYYMPSDPSNNGTYDANYSYDDRGNLLTINRSGPTTNKSGQLMDALSFKLAPKSNQIASIIEMGDRTQGFKMSGNKSNVAYTYDDNGNITVDPARGITNTMNHLNKVNRITKDASNYIDYYYDAGGLLHRKKVVENGQVTETRDYLRDIELVDGGVDMIHFADGFVRYREGLSYQQLLTLSGEEYQDTIHMAEQISSTRDVRTGAEVSYLADSSIIMTEGFEVDSAAQFTARIEPGTAGHADWAVYYTIRDHVGSTRSVVSDMNLDGSIDTSEVLQSADYMPYGVKFGDSKTGDYHYDRDGAERQTSFDLGLDMHAFRDFDPTVGRFRQIDPMADFAPDFTPYRLGFNNPVNYSDPLGLFESRDAAKKYARNNDIKLGLFSQNRIVKQKDGTYAIENKKDKSSIIDDPEFGINKGVAISSDDIVSSSLSEDGSISNILRDGSEEFLSVQGGTIDVGPAGSFRVGAKVASNLIKELPKLDRTGKVHGTLPKIKDLSRFTIDELSILLKELRLSVQRRIRVTSRKGRHRPHGQRQGQEQDLIHSIEKHLSDRIK